MNAIQRRVSRRILVYLRDKIGSIRGVVDDARRLDTAALKAASKSASSSYRRHAHLILLSLDLA